MRIANPLMLLLLFFIPLLFYYRRRFKFLLRSTIRFSDSDLFKGVKPSFKIRLRNKLVYLKILALAFLIIAASRPQSAIEETRIYVEGVDIVLAIDTSTSMYAMDFELEGRRVNRLDAVKRVVSKFIERRTNDRIGIVAFASYAYTVCPLTLDHVWLEKNLERINIGMIKDGTAIGSAIAGSLNRLKDTKAKEKIIILLTDGRNNAGNISPLVAAETAKTLGVKIYTIGAGTKGLAPFPVQDVFGNTVLRPVKVEIDDKLLKEIAKITDAEYFRATDTNSLEDIYERIDKLEKTKIEETGYNIYKELFGYFLVLGLMFLLIGIFLSNTIFRRIPQMKFGSVYAAVLLWTIPLLVAFYIIANKAREKALKRFAEKDILEEIDKSYDPYRVKLKRWLIVIAVFFLVIASMRPQWGFKWQEVKRRGLDIIIALDTSKSMLAEDILPNRLQRAKLAIKDFVKKLYGDRVGLIVFSGTAFLQCPLTVDYNGFFLSLNDVDVYSLPVGGTSLANVIYTASKSYEGGKKKDKILILITDGEDLEGGVSKAIQKAKSENIKVFCVGVGSEEGELIPVESHEGKKIFLKNSEGKIVKTRLSEDVLQKIALETGGIYVRATGTDFGLDIIYKERLEKLEKQDFKNKMQKRYFERFQIPLVIAIVLLFLEAFIGDRKKTVSDMLSHDK